MSQPNVDPGEFRRIIGQFTSGVTVIATDVSGEVHAMTANAVSSLSLEPTLALTAVAKRAKMAALLEQADGFSINILRQEQQALSNYFAGMWQEETPPPFRFVAWEGGPRLEGCLAALGCARHQILDGGDHWIVIGRVVALHQGIEPRRPLLFYSGRYGRLDTTDTPSAPDLGWQAEPVQAFYDPWQQGN